MINMKLIESLSQTDKEFIKATVDKYPVLDSRHDDIVDIQDYITFSIIDNNITQDLDEAHEIACHFTQTLKIKTTKKESGGFLSRFFK